MVTSFQKVVGTNSETLLPLENTWFVNYNYKKDILDLHIFDILPENSKRIVYTIEAKEQGEKETIIAKASAVTVITRLITMRSQPIVLWLF